MCLSPIRLKDRTLVACRGCRICRDNRTNDLVGRCLAEQATATKTFALTLTYRGDGPETAVLYYSHVQLFLKNLRYKYSVRYIVAGEYGEQKGRTHWHIVLFFYGDHPDFYTAKVDNDPKARVIWDAWPHGFIYAQTAELKGFRYLMKYALKGADASVRSLSMSKKPPLGHAFFMNLAKDIVDRGLPIQSPEYAFANVVDRNNKPRRFWLQGRMREMFLDEYSKLWRDKYKTEPPHSKWFVERYLDPIARKEMDLDPRHFDKLNQLAAPDELGYLFIEAGKPWLAVAYSDGTAHLFLEREKPCLVHLGSAANVEQQLQTCELSKNYVKPVCQFLLAKWEDHGLTPSPA